MDDPGPNLAGRHQKLALGVIQVLIVESDLKMLVVLVGDAHDGAREIQRIRLDIGVGLEELVHAEELEG